MSQITNEDIVRHLKSLPEWSKHDDTIQRTFAFKGFLSAIDFVNQVAKKAEESDHHPDIDIRYKKVTLTLTTHDQGGLTAKDFSLAQQCDDLYLAGS
jgi:4a-hydroxytetrahydrobiopterin dehydratase